MLAASTLVIVVMTLALTAGGDHVTNHEDYSLLPHPQRQVMSASGSNNSSRPCPNDCRCDEYSPKSGGGGTGKMIAAECWNVVSLPDLLDELGARVAALTVTYCESRHWLDSFAASSSPVEHNSTAAAASSEQSRRHSVPPPRLAMLSLVELTLSGCPLDGSRGLLNQLGALLQLAGLKSLRISDSAIGANASLDLANMGRSWLASLESLDLAGNQLTEISVGSPLDDHHYLHKHLSQLNLSDNQLTAVDVPALVRLFPNLQRLNLSANSLQDVSSGSPERATAAAASSSQLRYLDLSRNPMLELVCNAVLSVLSNLGKQQIHV